MSTINLEVDEDGVRLKLSANGQQGLISGAYDCSVSLDGDGGVTIAATNNTPVRLISGGKQSYFNPDGSGSLCDGKITWDADGNLTVAGKVNAESFE